MWLAVERAGEEHIPSVQNQVQSNFHTAWIIWNKFRWQLDLRDLSVGSRWLSRQKFRQEVRAKNITKPLAENECKKELNGKPFWTCSKSGIYPNTIEYFSTNLFRRIILQFFHSPRIHNELYITHCNRSFSNIRGNHHFSNSWRTSAIRPTILNFWSNLKRPNHFKQGDELHVTAHPDLFDEIMEKSWSGWMSRIHLSPEHINAPTQYRIPTQWHRTKTSHAWLVFQQS